MRYLVAVFRGGLSSERSMTMTAVERESITYLQAQGLGYKRIASRLGLPTNTVKSFCSRNTPVPQENLCAQCGCSLIQNPGRRQKRFCSNACRMAWWRAHPNLLDRKVFYDMSCAYCGGSFKSYGNPRRKY